MTLHLSYLSKIMCARYTVWTYLKGFQMVLGLMKRLENFYIYFYLQQ